MGHRIAKIAGTDSLRFVYDGDQVILDLNGNNSVRTEYGYQADGQAVPYSIKQDSAGGWTGVAVIDPAVGTLLGIANYSGGGLIKQYAPDPWGRQATVDTGVKVRLRMAGQEYDAETGLYHMGARYYDPDAGRFLSEDPIGLAGGINYYAYAGNNPVLQRDPQGTDFGCTYSYDQTGEEVVTYSWSDDIHVLHIEAETVAVYSWVEHCSSGGDGTGINDGMSDGSGDKGTQQQPQDDVASRQQAHEHNVHCALSIANLGFNALLDWAGVATGGEVLWALGRAGTAALEHEAVTIAVNGAKSEVLNALAANASNHITSAAEKATVHLAQEHPIDPADLIPGHGTYVAAGEFYHACF